MTQKEIKNLENGIYNVTWNTGEHSVAAIGTLWDKTKWIAPINRNNVFHGAWHLVKSVEMIQLLISEDGVCYGSMKDVII